MCTSTIFNKDDFHAAITGYLRFDEESQQLSDDRLSFALEIMKQPMDILVEMDPHDLAAMFSGVIGLNLSGNELIAATEFQSFLDRIKEAVKDGVPIAVIFRQSYRWARKQKDLKPYLFKNQKGVKS